MSPPFGVPPGGTTIAPFSTFQPDGLPSPVRHRDRSLPSNSTIASDGGLPGASGAPPGVTTLGWGRSGSCTCHLPPGNIGVSVYPTGAWPSAARLETVIVFIAAIAARESI